MIRSTAIAVAILIGSLLLETPAADSRQAAQRDQQPVFRAGANFVNVDVYPRRDGRLIEGLAASDFQVFEDGKPQKIEHFELIRIDPTTPDAERRDPNTQRDAERLLEDPRRRVFVVFLDEYHITRETAGFVRGPLVEFLERVIGRTDLFALMTPDVAVGDLIFGQRLEVVEAALAGFWRRMQFDGPDPNTLRPRTPYESFLYECYIGRTDDLKRNEAFIRRLMDRHRVDLVLTSLEQLSARMASLRDERTNVLLFSPGWTLDQPDDSGGMAWGVDGALPQVGVTRGGRITTSPTQPFSADRTKCDSEYLRLVSIEFERRFTTLVEDARRSNVSFTTIDPGGLEAPNSQAAAGRPDTAASIRMSRDRRDALRTLSENTDGMAIVDTNDLRTPLRRLADNLAAYYLLGYYSTNTNHDGRYRRIDVKVAARDVRVTARPGYRALTAETARAAESAPPPRTGTTPVEDALGALGRLRPAAELFTYGAAWPGRLTLVVELPAGSSSQSRWPAGADVQVSVTTAAGDTAGTATGRIERPGRSVLLHVPIPEGGPGPWRASIRVGEGANRLDDRVEVFAGPDGPIGSPLLFRGGPSAQAPARPAADPQFSRTERLQVEWPVREPLDGRAVRVLGRNGQPLALTVPVTDRQSDGQTVLVVSMSLASLAAGDYVLELVTTRGSRTDRSLVAFRVAR